MKHVTMTTADANMMKFLHKHAAPDASKSAMDDEYRALRSAGFTRQEVRDKIISQQQARTARYYKKFPEQQPGFKTPEELAAIEMALSVQRQETENWPDVVVLDEIDSLPIDMTTLTQEEIDGIQPDPGPATKSSKTRKNKTTKTKAKAKRKSALDGRTR